MENMEQQSEQVVWRRKQLIRVIWVNVCRFLLGGVFIFSGFVKVIDPFGFYYKLQDYLTAFGLMAWIPSFLLFFAGTALSVIEFYVGVCLFLGIHKRVSSVLALLLMVFMTPLTLYLAIANPVSDCGCFGDAWILTNWQTFWKNVVLLIAAGSVFRWRKEVVRFITRKLEWIFSMYTILFAFALSFYCLHNLPVIDFRPYKIGVNIKEGMTIPADAEPTVYDTRFVLEKNGERKEFTLDNYPDSTWTFVETRNVVVKQGYEPPIHEFYMTSLETGEDITEQVLEDEGYTFLLIAHQIEAADDSHIDLINEIYDYSVEHGYGFYALTASQEEDIELWCDRTGAEYPFCLGDDITLKTIIRSNPGMLLLKGGTILNKWSDNNLPDEYALTDALEKIPLGQQQTVSVWQTVGRVMLWFVIPLCLVLLLDIFIIKPRDKNSHKLRGNQSDGIEQLMDKSY